MRVTGSFFRKTANSFIALLLVCVLAAVLPVCMPDDPAVGDGACDVPQPDAPAEPANHPEISYA